MKTKLIIILFSGLTIIACKKSEKDFTGKYLTMYSSLVKDYYDLNRIQLEVFKDQSGAIKGRGSIVLKERQNPSYQIGEQNQTAMFELTNFRIESDTLFFLIENKVLDVQGTKLKGFIYKGQGKNIVGLDVNMTFSDGLEKSPCFLSRHDDYVWYKEFTDDSEMKKRYRNFYEVQIPELKAKINEAVLPSRKSALAARLDEVQKHLDN